MNEEEAAAHLAQAQSAMERGDWGRAYEILRHIDASGALSGQGLGLLADVAYAAGHLDLTIDAWERAHAEALRAGDRLAAAAAAVRVAMHLLFDTAMLAPVRGWLKRAEQLLAGEGETSAHAWFAVVRNYERLLSGDFQAARAWARRAIELGSASDPAAAAIGRVAEARSLILEGQVSEGLPLLDEVGVTVVSGELGPLATGIVYCELVCGLQGLAQYDLAEQWTEAMERWRHGHAIGSIHGRCRVHRAEILRLRGRPREAEKEALLACEELRPYLRRELGWPLSELGRVRLRLGDLQGAEDAFLAADSLGWDPQPGLALVQLARGELSAARASIRDALEHPLDVPSKELPPKTELRRAPLLEAQVEIELAAGEAGGARAAAEELSLIASRFQSKALTAASALAWGRVRLAEGDAAGARRDFEASARAWHDVGAPYEAALARMGVARAHLAQGSAGRALLGFKAAQAAFEQVGAARDAALAAAAASGVAVGVSPSAKAAETTSEAAAAAGDAFRREGDYWEVSFEGKTVRMRDSIGMRYLCRMLAEAGRELHVLDLVAGERRAAPARDGAARALSHAVAMHAGALLDTEAKAAYRRRLAEIEEDIEEAMAMGDDERAERSRTERDFLVRELARAVGLGGRDRFAASAAERARASVTRALRQAMARISQHHPELGQHLQRAIRTGTYCAYLPDTRLPAGWRLQ